MAGELERVRKALRELGKSLKSLPGILRPNEVHKLRTATRRVEAIAAVLPPGDQKKSRRLLKSIEPVRKAAGDVRDMDVLISNARRMARYSAGDSLTRLIGHLKSPASRAPKFAAHAGPPAQGGAGKSQGVLQACEVGVGPCKSLRHPADGQTGQPQEGSTLRR